MSKKNFLALDLGAESGRAIVGSLDNGQFSMAEACRFDNVPYQGPDGLHWDLKSLWGGIRTGIRLAVNAAGTLDGIGLDTWGVDFALLDEENHLLGDPHHYRDPRTNGMPELVYRLITPVFLFEQTGTQTMQFNTIFQLYALKQSKPAQLEKAFKLLMMPDLFNYWLSGNVAGEFTAATTTQLFCPRTRDWAWPILNSLGIPEHLFQQVIPPGTILGSLLPEVARDTGAAGVQVIAPACHDTGSAVVAVPSESDGFAWISSGTWSIIGVETDQPNISARSLKYNFTNEGGVFGTWRLSKNVMGLWLVQECKRAWQKQGQELSYATISQMATEARPFISVIDPDDSSFLPPGDMPERVCNYCIATGQVSPQTMGEVIRVVLESLALKYRFLVEQLEELTKKPIRCIHIIGGGSRNQLLNQFTADATGCVVIAGPAEATALGNIIVQAIGLGDLGSLEEARHIICTSFPPEVYHPSAEGAWDKAFNLMKNMIANNEQT